MTEKRYRAFISYGHGDAAWSDWLHRTLETFRTPAKLAGKAGPFGPVPRRLTPIFRDRSDLAAAHSLSTAIEEALADSLFIIVICSPEAACSHWVNEEIRLFKKLNGENRVLSLIVAGEPFASGETSREDDECFPLALRRFVSPDGAITDTPAEPIAADLRPGGDGKRYARLKIAAGLLGVRLDDLIQRDAARRAQRSRAVAAGAALIAAGMGALAFEARLARLDAERQRAEAENLIEFMLTDLREKLEPVGRLDTLGVVGERALGYYGRQNERRLDADALGRRSRALLLVGEIDNLRGDLDAALAAYEKAAATTAEQLRRDPANGRRLYDHAQSVFWVGYIAWQRGDRTAAEAQWRDYLSLAERMVAAEPDNADYEAELGYAYSNLGTLLIEERRWAEAADFFELSRQRNERLVAAEPESVPRLLDLAQDHSWIARAHSGAGRFLEARRAFAAELAIYERIFEQEDHQSARSAAQIAQLGVAQAYMAEGRMPAALSLLGSTRDGIVALIALDPQNTRWRRNGVTILTAFANAALFSGDEADAGDALKTARMLATELLAADSSVITWNMLASRADMLEARLLSQTGDRIGASELLRDSLARLEAVLSTARRGDYLVASTLAETCRDLGVLVAPEDPAEARRLWETGLARFDGALASLGPTDKTLAASLLLLLDRREESRRLIAELEALNYRHPGFLILTNDFATAAR